MEMSWPLTVAAGLELDEPQPAIVPARRRTRLMGSKRVKYVLL